MARSGTRRRPWQNALEQRRHMANPAGIVIQYELMTPDPDTVAPFYAGVAGWRFPPPQQGHRLATSITAA